MNGLAGAAGVLKECGIELDGEEDLIVEREVAANGKSRAFVANKPVTTAFLKQLAPVLGDIHGQNEQQLLFTPVAQRQLLDEYAKADPLRGVVAEAFDLWRDLGAKLDELGRNKKRAVVRHDCSISGAFNAKRLMVSSRVWAKMRSSKANEKFCRM